MFNYPDIEASSRIYNASEGQGSGKNHDRVQGQSQNYSSKGQSVTRGQGQHYQGSKAWWSVGEYLHQGLTHKSVGLSLGHADEESWDISDSLADLYQAVTQRQYEEASRQARHHRRGSGGSGGRVDGDRGVDKKRWLDEDTSHGFIRVYTSDDENSSRLFPCTLSTPAQKICLQLGIPGNSLHVQMNGDVIRRMESFDCPLAIQNEYLAGLGYEDIKYIQQEGLNEDLAFMVRFYSGKPMSDSTYSRNQLQTYAYVRKGKLLHHWARRWCVISGTRLHIHREKGAVPTVIQLARGSVEEVQVKGQSLVLKLTSTYQGERSIYLSFVSLEDYNKWLRKIRKATVKLPSKADLSNSHLEFIPENVFVNTELQILNLRHNVLRERPIEEDIYTIGWLDDLPTFTFLRSLNLADNQLMTFPLSLCGLLTLRELNLASNKLEEIPPEISKLSNLQVLHLHNNRLTSLPEEMAQMRNLTVVVLAFNCFVNIPAVLLQAQQASFRLDSIIMAGNEISRLPADHLGHMGHIKKIDLRLNKLQLLPTETAKFQSLEHITHVDIRENNVADLDIRAIRCLEYLNCEHNSIKTLQINGSSLKNVFASHNHIQTLTINPKPEWLVGLTISHNQLTELPAWLPDCLFLVQLDVQHNKLTTLPDRILTDAKRLKILKANHNCLTILPEKIRTDTLEELHLQHNFIRQLSVELFIKAHRLRYLNMTRNKLCDLPPPNKNDSYNKLQELYLSFNHLNNQCLHKICCFPRLRVLHLAKNKLSAIEEIDIEKLEQLTELNVSSNNLTYLPAVLGRHPKLQVLRANCNLLQELPNFKNSSGIKVLEVSSNHLVNVNMTNLMASQMSLLDISANPNILVKSHDIGVASKTPKKLCMIDMRGQNLSLEDVRGQADQEKGQLWQTGLSQTSGIRNKLSVTAINKPHFGDNGEALFAIFDGGRNEMVATILTDIVPSVLREERARNKNPYNYLKLCFLSAHRNLKTQGQKLGAAAAIAHIYKDDRGQYTLSVANVGDVQVVLCRQKRPYVLTRKFVTSEDVEDNKRVIQSGGIITEDGRVSGVTYNTRLLGCSYLFPHVIPDPYVTTTALMPEDSFFIIASHGLWHYVSYEEAIMEIMDIPDPVVAAKRLQDLAQGYRSRENISVLVVRLMITEEERSRMKDLMVVQRSAQKELIKILSCREDLMHLRDGVPKAEELDGVVINKSGHARKNFVGRHQHLDARKVSSFISPQIPDSETDNPHISVQQTDRSALQHNEAKSKEIISEEAMSHKKLRKEKSEGFLQQEDYLPGKNVSNLSRSENSIEKLSGYKGLHPFDKQNYDTYHNNSKQEKRESRIEQEMISRKINFLSHQNENDDDMPTDNKVCDDDDDIFESAEDSVSNTIKVTELSSHHRMSPSGAESDLTEKNNDFYYRVSPYEDGNISPCESVSSIDVRVDNEADEIYKLRYIKNEMPNKVNDLAAHLRSTKMYSSALSESNQLNENEFFTRPLSPDSIISQDDFVKPPVSIANIDRDALFFHQMQMARAQAQSGSNSSLNSIQSAPMHSTSSKESISNLRTSSHSIEVLLNLAESRSHGGLSGSMKEGRGGLGSSMVGTRTPTSSCLGNVGSGSETRTPTSSINNIDSQSGSKNSSKRSFHKLVTADVHNSVFKEDDNITNNDIVNKIYSTDNDDMNDSDNDTLVGEAQDLADIKDFDFLYQDSDSAKNKSFENNPISSSMERSLRQVEYHEGDSDSDSDESLGNLSLEDGYSAIQFIRLDRKGSLSMTNVLEHEAENYPVHQTYIKKQNKSRLTQNATHFLKNKPGSFQKRTRPSNKHEDDFNHYETIDDQEASNKNIYEYMDDINPYEDVRSSPPKLSSNVTPIPVPPMRKASVSSEEDIDAFYTQVQKIKRDKLLEHSESPHNLERQLQTFLPMFHSESNHNVNNQSLTGKRKSNNYQLSDYAGLVGNDSLDENKILFTSTSDVHSLPHSTSNNSTFSTAPNTLTRDHAQSRQPTKSSESLIKHQHSHSYDSHSSLTPAVQAISKHSSYFIDQCNITNIDVDSPVSLSRSPYQISDQVSNSYKTSATNLGIATSSHFSSNPTQHSTIQTSNPPYLSSVQIDENGYAQILKHPRSQDMIKSFDSTKPKIPSKPTPYQPVVQVPNSKNYKTLPAPSMESFNTKPSINLVQSGVRSHVPDSQSVLSSHEFYPEVYQPNVQFCPTNDMKEAASKLSSQKSISITYL